MFLFTRVRGLYREADSGGAGAGAGAGAGSGTGEGAGAGTGTGTPAPAAFDWKGLNLDPSLQNVVEAHQWKSPVELLGSYTNLQKAMGIKSGNPNRVVILPGEKDPPEAWNDVYSKLGRPEKPEEYGLPVPDGQPKELAEQAAKWFHELGIPKGAAVKLAERWNAMVGEKMTTTQAAKNEAVTKEVDGLKAEWGADYNANTALVDKAAEAFGVDQAILSALKDAMGPAKAMKFFHAIGSKLGVEGKYIEGQGSGATLNMTPAQAQAEMARLRSDKSFVEMWNSKTDLKARQEARAQMARLQQLAAPGFTTFQ